MKKFLPPQLVLVCLLSMFLLHWLFPLATILPAPFNLTGLLPLLPGFMMMMAADGQFKKVGTNVKTFNEPDKLVTDGWFRFSRNPMYLGFLLILLGAGLLFGTLTPLLGPLAFGMIANLWYIPFEEQAMRVKFDPAYPAYQQRVREMVMNRNKLFFWLNSVLGILFLVTITTLLPREIDQSAPNVPAWNLIHEICGTLMLAISAIHLALHWGWVKAVVLRKTPHPAQAVRRNRATDLWLFAVAVPCAITGLMVWTLPGILPAPLGLALNEWRDLHKWSGMAMMVILGIHLVLHRKWITSQFQRRTKEQSVSPLRDARSKRMTRKLSRR